MPALGYSGSVSLSTHIKKTPRKKPIWELRYRHPGGESDKSLGPAWIDLDLWQSKGAIKHLRGRPADGFLTLAQAHISAEAFLAELGSAAPRDRRTFREACDAFLREKRREHKRGSSVRGYDSVAATMCARRWRHAHGKTWGECPLSDITPEDVATLRDQFVDEGRAGSTLNHYHHIIRGTFGSDDPRAKAWKRASEKNQSDTSYYTVTEYRRLKQHARNDLERAIFTLAAETGARRSEIIALKRAAVKFDSHVIVLEEGWTRGTLHETPVSRGFDGTKGHQARSVPLSANAARVLAPFILGLPTHENGKPLLVFSRDGQGWIPLDPDSGISKAFANAWRRAGLHKIRFHDLRHTFATQMMASGKVSVFELQEMLGHQDLATTQRYLHFQPKPEMGAIMTGVFGDDEQGGS